MQKFVGLLRGINVGGNRKLPMADLRAICKSIGFAKPQTYIQSGNLLFESNNEPGFLETCLSDEIEKQFGFRPDVMILSVNEFAKTAARYPFETENHKLAHILFLKEIPAAKDVKTALSDDYEPDKIVIEGRAVYTYLPNGVSGSKIDFKKIERLLKTSGTGRNWRTVQKLIELAA